MNDKTMPEFVNRITPWLLGFYFIAISLLFLAELGVPLLQDYFRATDQVLILLVLLILPVVIIGMSRFIHSLTVKISGQELRLELVEIKHGMHEEVSKVEANLGGQISNAEQALWPLLAGKDLNSSSRLKQRKIIIGSKLDTSHLFYGHLLALTIEHFVEGASCEIKFPNGGSMKNFADLQHQWIDIYIDYSGTCCQYFNIDHRGKNDSQILSELNQYGEMLGIECLPTLGAGEDYCLVMAPKKAAKHNIKNLQDLRVIAPQLTFSGDPEFLNRNDCFLGLKKYGIEFKRVKPCRIVDRYESMKNDEADVFVGYETDPEVHSGVALRLDDPDELFPRYQAIPLVSRQALDIIPGLKEALLKLHKVITTEDLIEAVGKLTRHDREPDVAIGLAQKYLENIIPKL